MNKRGVALLIISLCIVSGCGSNAKNTADVQVDPEPDATSEVLTQDILLAPDEDSKTSDPVLDEESTSEQETNTITLDFVDVFGEHYETTIMPDVPKHDYINDGFIRDGYKLAYEDDNYSSRLGIDVSRHQGKIDWEKVKAQGVEFTFFLKQSVKRKLLKKRNLS